MYTTANAAQPLYTAEELLSYVGQADIFSSLGFPVEAITSGKRFLSPLREDSHADCRFSLGTDGKYRFLDPARCLSLDCWGAVQYVNGCSFVEALAWVRDTFLAGMRPGVLHLQKLSGETVSVVLPSPGRRKVIQIKRRGYDGADKAWWRQFNIGQRLLKEGNVEAISDYWIDGRHFAAPKKAYAYVEEDGVKVYMPENEHRYRFVGTTRALSCYELLPQEGELLLITSSKKDALCLRSFGYNAVAPQGEGMDIPAAALWELKQRFRKVVLFYDNDVPGLTLAASKVAKWQVTGSIVTPAGEPKDPADYCKHYGVAATEQLLTTLTTTLYEADSSKT